VIHEHWIQIFNDSFDRCNRDPAFLDRFYDIFISSNDEVSEKFKNTDMDKQKGMLQISLSYMMMAHQNPRVLDKVAVRHNANNLDIGPHLYSLWLDCMVEAVKRTDAQFSDDVEQSWRQMMQPGIDYIMRKYPVD
jgi:hemoglobin-like flavoprotein